MKPTVVRLGKAEAVFTNSDPKNIFCVAAEGESTCPSTLELDLL